MKSLFVLSTLLAFSLGGCSFGGGKEEETPEEDHARYEIVSFAPEHPFVTLTPTNDGRNITVELENFESVKVADVELTYFSGDVQQGVFDRIDLKERGGKKQIYLGSCSESTGVRRCYDHKNVEKGVVNATYDDGGEKKKRISSDFHLQEVTKAKGSLVSSDGKAKVFVPSSVDTLTVITVPTTGLPASLPDTASVFGVPYAFFPAREVQFQGSVSIDVGTDASGATLYQWDQEEQSWKSLVSSVSGSNVTASISSLGLFVVGR